MLADMLFATAPYACCRYRRCHAIRRWRRAHAMLTSRHDICHARHAPAIFFAAATDLDIYFSPMLLSLFFFFSLLLPSRYADAAYDTALLPMMLPLPSISPPLRFVISPLPPRQRLRYATIMILMPLAVDDSPRRY